jgi:ribonuclease HI
LVADLGKSRGFSTNNAAELYALGMLALKLVDLLASHPHVKRAVVFCDSKIAIDACDRPKKSKNLANASIVRALQKTMQFARLKLVIELRWVKGHATVGGNERADLISKRFANVAGNSDVCDFLGTFDCHFFSAPWAFGFPLAGLPLDFLTSKLPVAPAVAGLVPAVALSSDPVADSSVSHARRARPRTLRARVVTEGSRRSARFASRSTTAPPIASASLTDELDYKHCD